MTTLIMGRYEVVGLLGSGGIGQVYAARDQALGRSVAIKALKPEYSSDRSFLERFHAEAASLARLSHPNIATLYDLQADGQQFYMIMELVRGHTLEAVLARTKRIGVKESLAVTAQIIAGLGYAHRMGVIHRDIKPSNVMLTDNGVLKIMDFGIARVRGSQRLTRTGSIVGTLAYVAPEQIKGGEGDERSDLYGLACVLYEMLSGDPPFSADTEYELIRAQVDAPPKALSGKIPDLPAALNKALMRGLAKDPQERFASVEEFGRALGTAAISGQSADILKDNVMAAMGPSPEPVNVTGPITMPALARPGRGGSPGKPAKNRLPDLPSVQLPNLKPVGDLLRRIGQGMPAFKSGSVAAKPIAALGGGAALLLLVFGFIAVNSGWFSSAPPGDTRRASVDSSHQTHEIPCSSLILQPPGSQAAKTPCLASSPGPQPVDAGAVQLPLPGESPAYKGRVADWPGPNLIAVPMGGSFGLKFLKLYGILDASAGGVQANQDHVKMKDYLAAAGNDIVCYARGEGTFQCYANKQDIALWAVKNGLAKPTPDAPREYLK